jgi:hypothetical protein
MIPAWRIPPPSIFRILRARAMNFPFPQITEPTGAASPFVEDPGAVEVDGDAAAPRELSDGGGVVGRQRGAVTAVVGIFQTDEPSLREMDVVVANGGPDLIKSHCPVRQVWDGMGEDAAQGGHSARLIQEDVRAVSQDRLFAAGAVREHADDVAHRAAYDQERRFHSQHFGRHRLKPVDRGVFGEDVVAEIGVKDGSAHGWCGKSYRVASQIYDGHDKSPNY